MLPSDLLANPFPEFGDFLGSFSLGVKFRDGASGGNCPGKARRSPIATARVEDYTIRGLLVSSTSARARAGVHDESGGFPVALATCTLEAIAARSNAEGRQGISRKSAAAAITSTPGVAWERYQ
jgi:hypothetical protein